MWMIWRAVVYVNISVLRSELIKRVRGEMKVGGRVTHRKTRGFNPKVCITPLTNRPCNKCSRLDKSAHILPKIPMPSVAKDDGGVSMNGIGVDIGISIWHLR